MGELEQMAREWFRIQVELRLRVPNGKAAEKIFSEVKGRRIASKGEADG